MIPLPLPLVWVKVIALGVAVAVSAAAGAYATNIVWSKRWADRDATDAERRAENTSLVLSAEKSYLNRIVTAERERDAAQATIDTERHRADVAADKLRRAGSDYVAAIDRADTTVAACRQRAAALWDIFQEADREAGGMAQAADEHAADLRKMMVAWPT